jgi:hypothetical protein
MADTAGQPKGPTGRPSTYTEEVGNEICQLIASGLSARRACEKAGVLDSTFFMWVFTPSDFNDALFEQYERARAVRAERMLDETIEIADSSDPDRVQVDRLRCDVRDKALARMSPKRYADLKRVQHSGDMTVRTKRIVLDGE